MTTVTIENIKALVVKEDFWNNGKTTVCILTLKNGFEVVGTSGVVDKLRFDEELGKKYAHKNAMEKVWELEGYRLQCSMGG